MDLRATRTLGFATMALTVVTTPQARALEIDQLVGRWSSTALDECVYPEDSEGAPLRIIRSEGGTEIGNYGWLCTVKSWTKDGDFLVGEAKACGQEGDGETFDDSFVLGLNAKGELLMSKDSTDGLRRCPETQAD